MNCLRLCISIPDLITVIGLLFDIGGIILLFWVAPEKYPDPQSTASFAIAREYHENWRKAQKRRGTLARVSLLCIVIGFILQACAVIFF